MNIAIKNINGINENVVVVRYFQFNGVNYLIFTKNEVDESGYQKLYISKIVNMVGNSITDEVEWNLLRDTIKVIAKANKENTTLPVQDLNELEINGLQLMGEKPFKLTSASVALLSANKAHGANANLNTVNNVNGMVSMPQVSPINNQPVSPLDSVVTPVAPSINSVPSPMNIDSVPNNANNITTMNVNTLQSESGQNLNNTVSTNVESDPFNSFNIANANTNNLAATTVVSAPVNVATPSIEPQMMAPAPTSNEVDVNLQSPINPVLETMPNLNAAPVSFEVVEPAEPVIDYKKLYEEQTLKLNTITGELDKYKNIVEQLKNILN